MSGSCRPAQAPEAQGDRSLQCTCSRGAPRWPFEAARSAGGAHRSSEKPRAAPGGEPQAQSAGGCGEVVLSGRAAQAQDSPKAGATLTLHEFLKADPEQKAGPCRAQEGPLSAPKNG